MKGRVYYRHKNEVLSKINSFTIFTILAISCVAGLTTAVLTINFNEKGDSELGIFFPPDANNIPFESEWIFVDKPYKNSVSAKTILDWVEIRSIFDFDQDTYINNSDLVQLESKLKSIQPSNFWGVLFICEEVYRNQIQFGDRVNVTWLGESLIGYDLYKDVVDSIANIDEWQDEMYFRMIRGFYNYFSGVGTRVGITISDSVFLNGLWRDYYGKPALDFIEDKYHFVVLYSYACHLSEFEYRTTIYFNEIDDLFSKQVKFWIVTKPWSSTVLTWEREVIALDVKYAMDRSINLIVVRDTSPDTMSFNDFWNLVVNATILYKSNAKFYEYRINGKNLLTGKEGLTYGWVEV